MSDEAIEALAHILAYQALYEADVGGYGWDAEVDSVDHFMPTARRTAERYLRSVAPILQAEAWAEGAEAYADWNQSGIPMDPPKNPYTNTE